MDVMSEEQRSYNMSRIRSTNTKPELMVFKILDSKGINYSKHFPIIGKPDIAFPKNKLVVFIDGEFWHGKNIDEIRHRLPKLWINKIEGNILRDKEITKKLKKLGWKVLRLNEKDLKDNLSKQIDRMLNMLSTHVGSEKNTKKERHIDIFSFFAGVGFLDLGFEENGYSVKFVNEYIPSFLEAYKYARKGLGIKEPEYGYHLGDVNELLEEKESKNLSSLIAKSKKAGNLTGFIAGPPCPDFSVAGKNRGGEGEKGKLTQSYMNLIIKQKPDFFLFENVRGLWRTKKHREFFEKIKKQAHDAEYITDEKLVNSIEYGAPQDRERIILLGFKKSVLKDLGYKFSKDTTSLPNNIFPWSKYEKYNKKEVFSLPWPVTTPFINKSNIPVICPKGIIEELTIEYWFKKNDVTSHPNSKHAFRPKAGLKKFMTIDEGDVSKKSYKRLHRWRYSPTAAYGNNEVHIHPYLPRRITVAEALAIQSLPKNFCFPESMTLTDMFKTIGNGVPFMLSRSIAKSIWDFLM